MIDYSHHQGNATGIEYIINCKMEIRRHFTLNGLTHYPFGKCIEYHYLIKNRVLIDVSVLVQENERVIAINSTIRSGLIIIQIIKKTLIEHSTRYSF